MPWNGFEIKRIVSVVTKSRPDLLDAFIHALFKIDERVAAPQLLLNLVAGHNLA